MISTSTESTDTALRWLTALCLATALVVLGACDDPTEVAEPLPPEIPSPVGTGESELRVAGGGTGASEQACPDGVPAHVLGYVDGELIVTGLPEALDELDDSYGQRLRNRREIADFSRLSLEPRVLLEVADAMAEHEVGFSAEEFSGLRIERWIFDCGNPTEALLGDLEGQARIVAEPNRLSGSSSGVFSDPNNSIAPIDPDISSDVDDAHDAVATQVARYETRFATSAPAISFNVATAEAGANVAVFDNVPEFDPTPQASPYTVTVDWAHPNDMELQVVPYAVSDVAIPGAHRRRMDHGLFTAGIIHSIDPTANITIIEVLNNEGEGTLAQLEDGLFDLLKSIVPTQFNDPTPTPVPNAMSDWVLHLGLHIGSTAISNSSYSVETLLRLASAMGATTIVASGNFSNYPATDTMGVAEPADLAPSVTNLSSVGAASRGSNGQPDLTADACYARSPSTSSGIREFGGYAYDEGGYPQLKCLSQYVHKNCASGLEARIKAGEPYLCDDVLIGLSFDNRPAAPTPGTGHGFWIGTSFSSAAISGWVAAQK